MILYGQCETCKHKRFFIKRREILIPTGHTALSQKKMCRKCQVTIQKAVQINGANRV